MEKLIEHASAGSVISENKALNDSKDGQKIEPPLMIAVKNGVIEMVKEILQQYPSTVNIEEVNDEAKNIVLLAAKKKQTEVYKFLWEQKILTGILLQQVDNDGNSALQLAASYRGDRDSKYPGEVLLMQWEYKCFKFVRDSMLPGVFPRYKKLETADDFFKETHKELIVKDEEWMNKTSGVCSVVAMLIATVAFLTAATVPGGFDQEEGFPILTHKTLYQFFIAMSLMALCFSIIATILFLSIVTSRHNAVHFMKSLPFRLFLAMPTMFVSMLCIWISFCAGHSFLLVHQARRVYVTFYIIASMPGTICAITKFPVYLNLLTTSFTKVPVPSHHTIPARPKPPEDKKFCCDALSKPVKICEDCEK